MNKKAQWEQIVGVIIVAPILIALLGVLFASLNDMNCQSYKTQIQERDNTITNLNGNINTLNVTATFYKNQYDNLTTTNITKKDFQDLKEQITILNTQIVNVQNQVNQVNQNIISIQNIKTVYRNFIFSVTINIIFLGFLLFDFAIFNFEISKKIIELIIQKLHKLKEWLKRKFKKKEEHSRL